MIANHQRDFIDLPAMILGQLPVDLSERVRPRGETSQNLDLDIDEVTHDLDRQYRPIILRDITNIYPRSNNTPQKTPVFIQHPGFPAAGSGLPNTTTRIGGEEFNLSTNGNNFPYFSNPDPTVAMHSAAGNSYRTLDNGNASSSHPPTSGLDMQNNSMATVMGIAPSGSTQPTIGWAPDQENRWMVDVEFQLGWNCQSCQSLQDGQNGQSGVSGQSRQICQNCRNPNGNGYVNNNRNGTMGYPGW